MAVTSYELNTIVAYFVVTMRLSKVPEVAVETLIRRFYELWDTIPQEEAVKLAECPWSVRTGVPEVDYSVWDDSKVKEIQLQEEVVAG